MYQFNDQFSKATSQFAEAAASVNRLALENAEKAFGLQLAAISENLNASFAFAGELIDVRDAEGLKAVGPKGMGRSRTKMGRKAMTGASQKSTEPMTSSARSCGQTTSSCAPRNSTAWARMTKCVLGARSMMYWMTSGMLWRGVIAPEST